MKELCAEETRSDKSNSKEPQGVLHIDKVRRFQDDINKASARILCLAGIPILLSIAFLPFAPYPKRLLVVKQTFEQESTSTKVRQRTYFLPCVALRPAALLSRFSSLLPSLFAFRRFFLFWDRLAIYGRFSQSHRPWVAPSTRELQRSAVQGVQYTSQQLNFFVHPSLPFNNNNNIILHNSGRLSIHSFPFAGTIPTPSSLGPCAHVLAHSSSSAHTVLPFCSVVSRRSILLVLGLPFSSSLWTAVLLHSEHVSIG